MSPEPLVTVVIATWNWSQALRLSLRSALAQTERRIEVLVVADGCTDDTAQAVRAAADPRARLIELPVRTGSQAAPNDRGIAEARAPWIAYLGHDDLWHPRHLETLVRVAEREAADVAHAVGLVYGPPGTGQRSVSGITRSGRPERDAFFPPTTLLHRRDLTARVGPWPVPAETALPIDVDLQRRAWDAGLRFVPSGRATAFKFPAAHRRDAYRRRDVAEQAALLARLEQDADGTLAEELVDLAAALARNEGGLIQAATAAEPGRHHRRNLAHKGAAAEAAAAGPPPAEHVVGADCFDGPGEWYALERDAVGRAFRWSGPARTAHVELVVDAARPLVVEALLLHALTPDQWAGARLVVEGVALPTERCAAGDGEGTILRALVEGAAARGRLDAVRVGVEVPRTVVVADVAPGSADARRLGVGIAWLGARPAS